MNVKKYWSVVKVYTHHAVIDVVSCIICCYNVIMAIMGEVLR